MRKRFWETVALDDMTRDEWEALCDGCGRCCMIKLEDEDTGDVHYTNVTCRLFDAASCRCGNYALRRQLVPGCVTLTPETLPAASEWMPRTCAYRRLYEGRPLADWHPLVSGNSESVRSARVSVQAPTVAEYEVDPDELEDYIIDERHIHGEPR